MKRKLLLTSKTGWLDLEVKPSSTSNINPRLTPLDTSHWRFFHPKLFNIRVRLHFQENLSLYALYKAQKPTSQRQHNCLHKKWHQLLASPPINRGPSKDLRTSPPLSKTSRACSLPGAVDQSFQIQIRHWAYPARAPSEHGGYGICSSSVSNRLRSSASTDTITLAELPFSFPCLNGDYFYNLWWKVQSQT